MTGRLSPDAAAIVPVLDPLAVPGVGTSAAIVSDCVSGVLRNMSSQLRADLVRTQCC